MIRNIRDKLIWLGFGAIAATWLSYQVSTDLLQSLFLGAGALTVGLLFLAFYAANEA
ncbi:MAG: hypothetical protein Kow0031_36590 [Anaerolineae bacterium]